MLLLIDRLPQGIESPFQLRDRLFSPLHAPSLRDLLTHRPTLLHRLRCVLDERRAVLRRVHPSAHVLDETLKPSTAVQRPLQRRHVARRPTHDGPYDLAHELERRGDEGRARPGDLHLLRREVLVVEAQVVLVGFSRVSSLVLDALAQLAQFGAGVLDERGDAHERLGDGDAAVLWELLHVLDRRPALAEDRLERALSGI